MATSSRLVIVMQCLQARGLYRQRVTIRSLRDTVRMIDTFRRAIPRNKSARSSVFATGRNARWFEKTRSWVRAITGAGHGGGQGQDQPGGRSTAGAMVMAPPLLSLGESLFNVSYLPL